jgi:hypothetical protein
MRTLAVVVLAIGAVGCDDEPSQADLSAPYSYMRPCSPASPSDGGERGDLHAAGVTPDSACEDGYCIITSFAQPAARYCSRACNDSAGCPDPMLGSTYRVVCQDIRDEPGRYCVVQLE